MTVVTPKFGMGASVLRREDTAFIQGQGRYTDDIKPDGVLHGYVLRSPIAKASFTIGSIEAAKAAPGVHLVLTGGDLTHLRDLKSGVMQAQPDGTKAPTRDIPILCRDRVNYVGDAVAFVVADSRALAQDAAELIEVDYDGEDAASGTATALAEGTPLVWPELGSNRAFTYHIGDKKKTDAAFAGAAHVTRIEFVNNRLVCNYMEPRSAIGEWNIGENRFVLTTGSQGVHSMQYILASVFKIKKDQLRVITPDVGGGFGPKSFVYREYPLVLEAAKRLGRPVKWAGDRTEHFLTDAQGRDNAVTAEMALDKDGRFLGMRVELLANIGAYISQYGPFIPYIGVTMSTGVYDIRALDVSVTGLYTNTCPVDAYRGAGRPEAAFLLEKLVDACAHDLGLPVEEIRRRNFIRPEQFPYRTQTGRLYDNGEFEGHMDRAIERSQWKAFPQRLEQSKADGKIRGIGMATYIEACAFPGSEPAFVELNGDGTVTLKIGTQTNGQGHATAYAQFLSEKLNLDIDKIHVRQGDTDELKAGGGTGGSRSIPLGGVSASRAGEDLANKIKRIAADELEASAGDIELSDGVARIVGSDRSIDFSSIAKAAKTTDDLKGFGEFVQDECTYPNGTHICEVEIDPDTGATEIVRYTIVDDFGVTVNPILLAGQVHGGVVQGIGQALTENTIHGEDGQLLTASFMDYAMPRADNFPFFHFETRNVPSTTNALGIKGAGEAGTIGSTPAALNAVTDALWRAYGIRHIEMPATPAHIWAAIRGRIADVTSGAEPGTTGGHDTLRGIALKIVSVAVFVGMQTCIKAAGDVPAGQIVFFRSFFAIFPIIAFLALKGQLPTAFVTKRPFNHVARGVVGVGAMGLGFFALTRLPLPEAITLNYAQPLLVVVFSSVFLGESIHVYRWSAVAVGLVGVLIISWPELTLLNSDEGLDDQEVLGVMAALVAAAISAVAMLLVRNLVQTEKTATIVLWFSSTASVLSLLTLPFGWQALTPTQAALLVMAGFCGGLGQILMTSAYRHAEASVVAPFEYTSMILGVVVGYFIFGDVTSLNTLIGGAIVVAAGIFIIWRERQLGLERTRTRKVTLPQGEERSA